MRDRTFTIAHHSDMNTPIPSLVGTTWFVSRHAGAIEWARRNEIYAHRWVSHVDTREISPGDTVIGSLPVHMAAAVCARGARYLHLALDLPKELRGHELTFEQLTEIKARLQCYYLEKRE